MFITFEGPEGSGKTSVINAVENYFKTAGYDVVRTREPGGTNISEQIRNVILDKENVLMDARTEALLYAASRRQHLVEKIWPAIKSGKMVFCDRYLDSSLAYQGGGRDLGVDEILNINMFATEGTFPNLTILFDIDPHKGMERISLNKNREVNRLDLEAMSFHKKVRNTFLELSEKYNDRYAVTDASLPLDKVIENVIEIIKNKFKIHDH